VSSIASRAEIEAWLVGYERAWRSAGTERLAELFCDDARYRMSPYEDPAVGLAEIAKLWDREREGPEERFEISHEIVAVDGDTGVVRVEVEYSGDGTEYRDLWIIRLAQDGRCREFEEWPFWPGQQIVAQRPRGKSL
jgi:ketosteroid isomerase-like protein